MSPDLMLSCFRVTTSFACANPAINARIAKNVLLMHAPFALGATQYQFRIFIMDRIAKALAISAAAHLAVVSLIQPVTRQPDRLAPSYVIQARLSTQTRITKAAPIPATPASVKPSHFIEPAEAQKQPPPAIPDSRSQFEIAKEAEPAAKQDSTASPAPPANRTLPLFQIPVIVDPNYYSAKEVDIRPRALAPIAPVFPEPARMRGISGTVILKLLLDEYGHVEQADVVEAKPPGYFEQSAMEAFRYGKFSPAYKDGRPVRSLVLIRVNFDLD
jgi:periplasmic protein TonB